MTEYKNVVRTFINYNYISQSIKYLSTRANSGEGLTIVSTVLFRSPLSLFSSSKFVSKTHLAAGNRDSKCQGFNDHTFSQEETLAGGVPNVLGLQKHSLHRNSRTATKETDGLAGVATAP